MPIHDWSRVPAGIFHDFHHAWIEEIKRALNRGVLPPDYYALAEQRAVGFGPDVLTLQVPTPNSPSGTGSNGHQPEGSGTSAGVALLLERPPVRLEGEADRTPPTRRTSAVAVRHVSDDRVVAVVEIVSAANKSRHGLPAFVTKALELLASGVHLLILDLLPPGPYDPFGIHAAIWDGLSGEATTTTFPQPLTLVAYQAANVYRYYLEPAAVGDTLIDMPLFLEPGGHVRVPLEPTYLHAWDAFPQRWRQTLTTPPEAR